MLVPLFPQRAAAVLRAPEPSTAHSLLDSNITERPNLAAPRTPSISTPTTLPSEQSAASGLTWPAVALALYLMEVARRTLYLGDYQGGLRVIDISGDLRGDLLRQGREMAHVVTGDRDGVVPNARTPGERSIGTD